MTGISLRGVDICLSSLLPTSDADHGTIRFIGPTGEVELINFYWSPESLQFGDQVEFKIGTRSYDQLVYATDLVVMEKAKDIRFKVSEICRMGTLLCVFDGLLHTCCVPR